MLSLTLPAKCLVEKKTDPICFPHRSPCLSFASAMRVPGVSSSMAGASSSLSSSASTAGRSHASLWYCTNHTHGSSSAWPSAPSAFWSAPAFAVGGAGPKLKQTRACFGSLSSELHLGIRPRLPVRSSGLQGAALASLTVSM